MIALVSPPGVLYRRGVPKKKIAEQLGMSRNTVKRLLRLKEKYRACLPAFIKD